MTKEQAQLIIDTHEIDRVFDDAEEFEMLKDNHPDLLDAYRALMLIAGLKL